MTIHFNDLRAATAGNLNGVAVNTTNSAAAGVDTLTDAIQPGTPGTMQYALIGGAYYVRIVPPTDTSVARVGLTTTANLTAAACRFCWTTEQLPNVAEQIQQIRVSGGLSCIITASTGATPRFLLLDAASGPLWTSSIQYAAGQEYRIETNIPQVSATTGQVQVKIYDGRGTGATLLDDSGLLTGKNLGASNITVPGRWGMLNRPAADTATMRFRDFAYNDVAGFIGGVSTSTPPVITVGGDITSEPRSLVTLSAIASDPAGGTLTYAWTSRSNTSISTPTLALSSTSAAFPTYITPGDWGVTGSQQTWRCTVTSSVTGLSAFGEVTVIVRPATIGFGRPPVRAMKAQLGP